MNTDNSTEECRNCGEIILGNPIIQWVDVDKYVPDFGLVAKSECFYFCDEVCREEFFKN